jgi:hypothetical protein
MNRNHLPATFILCLLVPLGALSAEGRFFDITVAENDFPVAKPGVANARLTTEAIQRRLDYLSHLNPTGGRVFVPAGKWFIDRPLVMERGGLELVGAGRAATQIRPVPERGAMQMVHVAMSRHVPWFPLQKENFVPLQGILDDSIPVDRFGLRTYAEFPTPGQHHTGPQRGDWKAGSAYKEGDLVKFAYAYNTPWAACLADHTADESSAPMTGAEWKKYWTLRIPSTVFSTMDPLSNGPYDPNLQRAAGWENVPAYTVDLAWVNNDTRPNKSIGGVVWNENPMARIWVLYLSEGNVLRLAWNLSNPDGTVRQETADLNPPGTPANVVGLFRVALQWDFTGRRVQAWVRFPGDRSFQRTLDRPLPEKTRFMKADRPAFTFGGYPRGVPFSNFIGDPHMLDYTLCGIHMSNIARYREDRDLKRRDTGLAPDDRFSYFTNDHGTIAFLPMVERGDNIPDTGYLVTEEFGDAAAGKPGPLGHALFWPGIPMYGRQHLRVSDLTLIPGSTWGAGLVNWATLDPKFWNLDIQGGYFAIGDEPAGCSYTTDIRDAVLAGSQAAVFADYSMVMLKRVTIPRCGRFGILLSGSNADLDEVTFLDPVTCRSEYYFAHIPTTYAGQIQMTHIKGIGPKGGGYPSRGALYFSHLYPSLLELRDVKFANMGPQAAFLDMRYTNPLANRASKTLYLAGWGYTGDPIAAFLRGDDPDICGTVLDYPVHPPFTACTEWLAPNWSASGTYAQGALVNDNGQLFRALRRNNSRPNPEKDSADWTLVRNGLDIRLAAGPTPTNAAHPPQVKVLESARSHFTGGTRVTIAATVTDGGDDADHTLFFLDDQAVPFDRVERFGTPAPVGFGSTLTLDGKPHTVTVEVVDRQGGRGRASLNVKR